MKNRIVISLIMTLLMTFMLVSLAHADYELTVSDKRIYFNNDNTIPLTGFKIHTTNDNDGTAAHPKFLVIGAHKTANQDCIVTIYSDNNQLQSGINKRGLIGTNDGSTFPSSQQPLMLLCWMPGFSSWVEVADDGYDGGGRTRLFDLNCDTPPCTLLDQRVYFAADFRRPVYKQYKTQIFIEMKPGL